MRSPRPPGSPRMVYRGGFSPTLRPGMGPPGMGPPGMCPPGIGPPGMRPPRFSPLHSPVRYRRFSPISPLRPMRPGLPPAPPTSMAYTSRPGSPREAIKAPGVQGTREERAAEQTSRMMEEAPSLIKETRLMVQNYDHTVKLRSPEVVSLTCSDLLSAYRLSQNLTRTRTGAYKYDPTDTVDIHRRLTVTSRRVFEKLSSPRKEKKGPYVPNRDIMKLFTNTPEAREREQLAMENEEFLHRHKQATYRREGEFFSAQNPDMLEKFQTTHEYIKNVYRHSKDNLLPPDEDIADMHDRVKHFCGVKNEELLEKLRVIEDRVRSQEWSGRVKDTREKMSKLYDENREFLAKIQQRQQKKMDDLLEENKEMIDSMKVKAKETKETIEIKSKEFDQMMEKTLCEAI